MTIAIIILAYVANVFLNRWFNKLAYKRGCSDITVWSWFVPIACTIASVILILESKKVKKNWFTGKNW